MNTATPPQKKEQIPLPIPKNHVILSLMELASISSPHGNGDDDSTYCCDEDDDDALVFDSIESLRGLSGTYVVKEKRGLMIYRRCDRSLPEEQETLLKTDSSGTLRTVMSSRTDEVNLIVSSSTGTEDSTGDESRVIEYGQRVQIVNRVDGVFRLARNRGFITASDSQLVKVGPPIEQSCKVEGMLYSVTKSQRILQRKLEKLVTIESKINRQLTKQLKLPESHPIITDYSIGNDGTNGGSIELYYRDQSEIEPVANENSLRMDLPQMMALHKENNAGDTTNISIASGGSGIKKPQIPKLDLRTELEELNFRTGLSGHLALQSNSKLENRVPIRKRSNLFMMSEARGIHTGIQLKDFSCFMTTTP